MKYRNKPKSFKRPYLRKQTQAEKQYRLPSLKLKMTSHSSIDFAAPSTKNLKLMLRLFSRNWFWRNHFLNFPVFVYHQKSWSMENTFQSKKNLTWFPRNCFPIILDGKHFPEVVKILEMSYYLIIISNLVLKLLIAIYIFWSLFLSNFNFIPQNLIFILILVLIFIIVICFSLIIF